MSVYMYVPSNDIMSELCCHGNLLTSSKATPGVKMLGVLVPAGTQLLSRELNISS